MKQERREENLERVWKKKRKGEERSSQDLVVALGNQIELEVIELN